MTFPKQVGGMILFSVLMSLYDRENPIYLDCCFESIANQTLQCDEIILVYDGFINKSLDETVSKWMKILPIIIIRLEKNVGLGQALNVGLQHCTYDIVARMDTDDICDAERFEKQINTMLKDKELGIVGSYISEFETDPNCLLSVRCVPTKNNDIKEYAKLKSPFNHMTVVFRKSIILSVGGYRHHYLMEDYNLWLRLLTLPVKAANIPLSLVKMRAGTNMLKRRKGIKYVASEFKLARLKNELGYQKRGEAICIFLMRSIPRVMPLFLMKKVYKIIRSQRFK